MDDEYINRLENVIKQMLRPLKDIPFSLVIESISGYKVIPYNPNDEKDTVLLDNLSRVAKKAGDHINQKGIIRRRPNEVGNDIEEYVKTALNQVGYKADIPRTLEGKKKSTGYPDIEFIDENGRINYLECKTYNIATYTSSMRSFYLSPSKDFKVTQNAHHFVISYEIYVDGRQDRKNIYKTKAWKILSISNLSVDVKYEFNSDNSRLYSDHLILAEGFFASKM
ncbi:MAG: restriction endonuclease [Candidatus Hodarchaeota archaeon]